MLGRFGSGFWRRLVFHSDPRKIPELEEKREQIEGLQKSIGEILKKEAPIWIGGAAVAGENAPLSACR